MPEPSSTYLQFSMFRTALEGIFDGRNKSFIFAGDAQSTGHAKDLSTIPFQSDCARCRIEMLFNK
jgi:hypothetical protein